MNCYLPSRLRMRISALAGIALVGSLLWLPGRGAAQMPSAPPPQDLPEQTSTDTSNSPSNPNQKPPPMPQAPKPPPANPLVLVNPDDGSGNANGRFDENGDLKQERRRPSQIQGRDYRRHDGDERTPKRKKPLPLFGYDFFRPARDLIRAHRDYLMRMYELAGTGPYPYATRNAAGFGPNAYGARNVPGRQFPTTNPNYPQRAAPPIGPDGRRNFPNGAQNQPYNGQNGPYPPDTGQNASPNDQNTGRMQPNSTGDTRALNGDNAYNNQAGDLNPPPPGTLYGDDRDYLNRRSRTPVNGPYDAAGDSMSDGGMGYDDQNAAPLRFDATGDTMSDLSGGYEIGSTASGGYGFGPNPARSRRPFAPTPDEENGFASDQSQVRSNSYSDNTYPDNASSGNNGYPDQGTNRNNPNFPGQTPPYGNPQGGTNDNYSQNGNILPSDRFGYPQNPNGYPQQNPYGYPPNYYGTNGFGGLQEPFGGQPGFTEGAGGSAVNAFQDVADPLSQLYRNVLASVPTNYQLAPGDTLTVRYWSPTQEARTVTRTVDTRGEIVMEGVGPVVVRGLTAEGAEKALRAQLQRYYKNPEVSVTLSRLRTIQVTVSGAAFQPGTYQVPAGATAYNVLYAAGGPTFDGTLRDIEVRRQGKIVGTLDIYKFLMVGTQGGDIALQTGDLITIPPRQSQVIVSGEVLHPATFELTRSETLEDALRYAGGIKASAVNQRIHITTLVPGIEREVKDVDIKKETADRTPLYDGDLVDIFSVRPLLVNKVTIEGAVDQPSDYELKPGMRLSDLIEQARGLLPEAYPARADLYRWNPDNTTSLVSVDLDKALAHDPNADVTLTRWDRLKVYTRKEVAWTGRRTVTVRGAVQRAGVYDYSQNMRVRDLLLMAGGPTPDAFLDRAVLLHQHGNGTYDYDFLSIDQALKNDENSNVVIQDNDILALYRVGEAHFEPEHFVTVRGDVVAPGVYPRSTTMRISDLMTLAGGFKPGGGTRVVLAHARQTAEATNAALITRNITFDAQGKCAPQDDLSLEDGDVITVQGTGGFQQKVAVITVNGAVQKPGPIVLENKQMRLSDALREVGGLRPEAFPEGAEFYRDPKMIASAGQRELAFVIAQLNNLLNDSAYKRAQAQSAIEILKATGSAATSDNSLTSALSGAAPAVNPAAGTVAQNLSQRDLVTRPRTLNEKELEPNGNIAVNLPEAMRHPGGSEDIMLMDGDVINVPETPTTVQVIGAVVNGRGILYKKGAPLNYYVEQAGGFTVDAAKDKIVIIHAGGGLIPANRIRELRPGDVILVPTRVLAEKISSNHNALDSIFRSLTGAAVTTFLAFRLFGL